MANNWKVASLLALPLATPGAVADDTTDVLSYRIDATIEDERIVEKVDMVVSSRRAVADFVLTLSPTVQMKACTLGGKEVPFQRAGSELLLDLKAAGSPKGEFTLRFELDGKPYNNQRNKYVRTVISPEHAYIRSQYDWYPRKADDMAVFETRLSVREGWTARTAGDLMGTEEVGGRVVWHYKLEEPTSDIGLAAGKYVSVERPTDTGLKLNALVFEGSQEGARALLDIAAQAIGLYTTLFGEMSEQHFTLVEMPPAFGSGSGYGETGYALIGSGAFASATDAPWAGSLITHEVAHTWWGREVAFSNFAGEMLATYSAMRFSEAFGGEQAALRERRLFAGRVCSVAAESGLVALDEIDGFGRGVDPGVYSACAYDKAAMLLHVLDRAMGRKAFDAALRDLFEEHRGTTIEYADVKRSLAGTRHRTVFEQWGSDEVPELSVDFTATKFGKAFSVEGTLSQVGTEKPFKMSVQLRAVAGDQFAEHVVKVKKAASAFKFKCAFEPESILIDPDCHLVTARAQLLDVEALTKSIFAVANDPGASDPVDLKRTIKNARKAIASAPAQDAHFYTAIGRCLFRLGDFEGAKQEFATALAGGAGGPFHRAWVHLRLGCIADLEKDRAAAVAHYERVLSSSKESEYPTQKKLARRFLEKAYRGYDRDG